MRITLKAALLLALLAGLPCAASVAAQGPQALIQETAEEVLAKLAKDKERLKNNPDAIFALIKDEVLPHFDFERMSRWVLGKHWRQADAQQQQRFMDEFRTLLVRTYATSLLEYTDQKVEYLPLRDDPSSGEVTVRSEIAQPGGFPIPIHYTLYQNDQGEWKVYDLSIDGVSLVSNYRSSFSKEIRQKGLDGLIETLAERNKKGISGQG